MILCPFFIIISETPGRARNQVMRRREERKAAMKAQLCLHTRLSLQISSWKVTNSFTFFNISQNLNIWHPTVKKIWEFGRFVGFPPDLWSDVTSLQFEIQGYPGETCSEPISEWSAWIHRYSHWHWKLSTVYIRFYTLYF